MLHKKAFLFFAVSATLLLSSFLLNKDKELAESMKRGKQVYLTNCMSCHMEDGSGMQGTFPPLANSDYLMEDTHRAIKIIKEGVDGQMVVNGETYYGFMPAQDLDEKQLADVMNYIRNSWGNKGELVTVEEVKSALK